MRCNNRNLDSNINVVSNEYLETKYKKIQTIGSGSLSEVFLIENTENQKLVFDQKLEIILYNFYKF